MCCVLVCNRGMTNTENAATSAIAESAQMIVASARATIDLSKSLSIEMDATDALLFAARAVIANSHDAASRAGQWSGESTTEQIESAHFNASVAQDIIDNTFRPSVGRVGDYARALLA